MTSSKELTAEDCVEKADRLFVDEKDLYVYAVDMANENVHCFKVKSSDEDEEPNFELLEENEDGSLEKVEKDVISYIDFEHRKEYEQNSRYWEVDPVTETDLKTRLLTLTV